MNAFCIYFSIPEKKLYIIWLEHPNSTVPLLEKNKFHEFLTLNYGKFTDAARLCVSSV